MKLMQVKDVLVSQDCVLLTGPLMVEGVQRRSEVQTAFGTRVEIVAQDGTNLVVDVNDVALSQPLSGRIQICLVIALPKDGQEIFVGSEVISVAPSSAVSRPQRTG